LQINTPIPFQGRLYRLKPASFLTNFLGHEGPGSIHRYLHKRGLITSFSAGTMSIGDGSTILSMDISLTKSGFSKSRVKISFPYKHSIYTSTVQYHAILVVIWKYIELLREQLASPTTTLPYFEELKELGEINFKFAGKAGPGSFATSLAVHLNQWYTTEDVLCGPYIYSEYSPDTVKAVLNSLRPENARVFLAAKSFEDIGVQGQWLHEKWYGTEYMHGPLGSMTSVCFHAHSA
jgi:insulysin